MLVGGFPCQNYSVASTLATSKGIEGSKGVLWWDIRDILEIKKPPFVLLENVDRLLKSPAKQRGRDFGIILACFRDLDYIVEWRVINAADYGYQQRRRRTFIFAYKKDTKFGCSMSDIEISDVLSKDGFFASTFPVACENKIENIEFVEPVGKVSESFAFSFENAGIMIEDNIYTTKVTPVYEGSNITLGDIMLDGEVDETLFIDDSRLYYSEPDQTSCDECEEMLPNDAHRTWQYVKGGKRFYRTATNGHRYVYSEGSMPMIDEYDKPARTMLTSEGNFSRSTHIVRDKKTGRIRLLSPIEAERIQGFPDNWTSKALVNGNEIDVPKNKRMFMMGNALVVNLIQQMEPKLYEIIDKE